MAQASDAQHPDLENCRRAKLRGRRRPPSRTQKEAGADGEKADEKADGPVGSTLMYARELVKECDKTKDGRITFAEFEGFVHTKERELEEVFRKVDTTGDNTIQYDELGHFIKASGIHVTDEELRNLMTRFDRDRDGSITFSEWRDFLLLLPHAVTGQNVFNYLNSVYNLDVNSDSMPFPDDVRNADSVVSQRVRYFLCGGLSGAVSRSVTAPLDRLKVLLVTQTPTSPSASASSAKSKTSALLTGIKQIYAQGGILSFYRGNGINVLKIAPESGMKFFTFETMKQAVAKVEGANHIDYISVPGRFVAGGVAGLISQFTIYPLETLKTRVMTQIAEAKAPHHLPSTTTTPAHPRLLTTILQMYRENGIRTFYRGCIPSLIGIVPYAGIDLATYETLRSGYEKRLRAKTGDPTAKASSVRLLGFGAVSAATGAVVMYPLSVIRTRLQAQGTPSHPQRYTNSFDVIRKTYAREGVFGFYRGLAPTLMKVLPAVSISYVVYEKTKSAI
ncbi:mitochondrial carrier domain-containing protein [Fimicolochytrium jonesii]|uniref:mitochondrial carrier domain-containing protein n=1 Tax=Fimicolochytrium jonesii TaxID=1396493 RepID=UPI0022FE8CFE|nr:mitochondrial carrier domain-containing protein [Fimicolochytrium jonesii]KAI8824164.1 mitochondrial carrier domain-containing protein [Fimicolochytrium jonesii]